MNGTFFRFGTALLLCMGITWCKAQTNAIDIRFIGNCGLYMSDGVLDVYVDFPYKSGAYGYMEYPDSEIDSIRTNATHLFTHRHADHYSKRSVKKLSGTVYGPWKVKKKRRADLEAPAYKAAAFTVETFSTKHRFARHHYSYLITWHGKRIYLSGDTEGAETIGQVKDIDLAFVPSWIMSDAKEKNITIDAARFAIYHLYPSETVTTSIPNIQILKEQGTRIKLSY
ncbi:MAG TPA: MBL fold metallo-hydrolase [Flavobacteriales bacterium]|nr:MBL fold metallo-hydrolase [Flavobacteriales bacterium]